MDTGETPRLSRSRDAHCSLEHSAPRVMLSSFVLGESGRGGGTLQLEFRDADPGGIDCLMLAIIATDPIQAEKTDTCSPIRQ